MSSEEEFTKSLNKIVGVVCETDIATEGIGVHEDIILAYVDSLKQRIAEQEVREKALVACIENDGREYRKLEALKVKVLTSPIVLLSPPFMQHLGQGLYGAQTEGGMRKVYAVPVESVDDQDPAPPPDAVEVLVRPPTEQEEEAKAAVVEFAKRHGGPCPSEK